MQKQIEMEAVRLLPGESLAGKDLLQLRPTKLYYLPEGAHDDKPSFIIMLEHPQLAYKVVGQFSLNTLAALLAEFGYGIVSNGQEIIFRGDLDQPEGTMQKVMVLVSAGLEEALQSVGCLEWVMPVLVHIRNVFSSEEHIEILIREGSFMVRNGDYRELSGWMHFANGKICPTPEGLSVDDEGTWVIWHRNNTFYLPTEH